MSVMRFLKQAGIQTGILLPDVQAEVTEKPALETAMPDAEYDALLAELGTTSAPTSNAVILTAIVEGVDFSSIYAQAGVVDGVYPIEKLEKLVAALNALDDNAKKAAIDAMDIADDTWTQDDILTDLNNKQKALEAYQQSITSTVDKLAADTEASVAAAQKESAEQIAQFRAQIAELEAKIQESIKDSTLKVANLNSDLSANRAAASREQQRVAEKLTSFLNLKKVF